MKDIRAALTGAPPSQCAADGSGIGKWKVTGPDSDGDDLTCVVALADDALVITLF